MVVSDLQRATRYYVKPMLDNEDERCGAPYMLADVLYTCTLKAGEHEWHCCNVEGQRLALYPTVTGELRWPRQH